ncbi:helix-turn-helix domain-containing protein [Brucella sp. H1_1004]|uniref:helix-turn-helix domain-containing protein n=1 Tax=Brucella sp. H1_1004 TaxID=3110109 RepID=UPI0039B5120E
MPHDQYQTVQEIADRLKVSEATVRHWIKDGSLRAIDIGKGWRISDADLQDFLRCHETRPRGTDGPVPEAVQTIRHLNGKSIQEH